MATPEQRTRFRRWVNLYDRMLYAACVRRVGNQTRDGSQLAQDLVQETYQTAWQRMDSFSGDDDAARAWLFRILSYKILNHTRHSSHRCLLLFESADLEQEAARADGSSAGTDSVADTVGARLDGRAMRQRVDALPPLDRRILQLRLGLCEDPAAPGFRIELSFQEIATVLTREQGETFNEAQVFMRYSRAVGRLRSGLEAEERSGRKDNGRG